MKKIATCILLPGLGAVAIISFGHKRISSGYMEAPLVPVYGWLEPPGSTGLPGSCKMRIPGGDKQPLLLPVNTCFRNN